MSMLRHVFLSGFILALAAASARADHGKGSTGTTTISPRTLHQSEAELDFSMRYQSSRTFSDDTLTTEALNGHDVHSARWALEYALGGSYGITDRLNVSIGIPYSTVHDFRAGEVDDSVVPPTAEVAEAGSISGLGDIILLGKYALTTDQIETAILAGVKLPTGSTSEKLDDGERLEPDHQPGSGSWDALFGFSAGTQVDQWTFAASALFRITTEGRYDFKPGDSLRVGARAELQVAGLGTFPRVYVSAELAMSFTAKDQEDGERNDDSGGSILSIGPGVRVRVDEHVAVGGSILFPVYQGLYGLQHKEVVEVLFGLAYTF
jgi:hypothetical protein